MLVGKTFPTKHPILILLFPITIPFLILHGPYIFYLPINPLQFFFLISLLISSKTFDFKDAFSKFGENLGDPTNFRFISASALRGLLNAR